MDVVDIFFIQYFSYFLMLKNNTDTNLKRQVKTAELSIFGSVFDYM